MATANYGHLIYQAMHNFSWDHRNIYVCLDCKKGTLIIIDSQSDYVIIECIVCGKLSGVELPPTYQGTYEDIFMAIERR
jgi:DNA-directed RNA polymerase subunit RPC12/RpoP